MMPMMLDLLEVQEELVKEKFSFQITMTDLYQEVKRFWLLISNPNLKRNLMSKQLIRRRNTRFKLKKKILLSIIYLPRLNLETHLKTTFFDDDKIKNTIQSKQSFNLEKKEESEEKKKRKLSLKSWMSFKRMRMRSFFNNKSKKNLSKDYACLKCKTNKRTNWPLKDEKGKWRNKWKKIFEILQIQSIINQKLYRIRLKLMWLKTFRTLAILKS